MRQLSDTRHLILLTLTMLKPEGKGLTLQELAEKLGLAPPTVHRHLERMVAEGLVARVEQRGDRSPRYKARPYFRATWVDPRRGLFLEWTSSEEFPWEFPLVSRVKDGRAQEALVGLLRELREKGLLNAASPTKGKRTVRTFPAYYVYGSCARGDARPDSDVDVLVLHSNPAAYAKKVRPVVDEQNLRGSRTIDLRVVDLGGFISLGQAFHDSLMADGVTVYTPFPGDEFIENQWLHSLLDAMQEAPDGDDA